LRLSTAIGFEANGQREIVGDFPGMMKSGLTSAPFLPHTERAK